MATWQDFSEGAPELAAAIRSRFEATKHHVLATLRRDGAPRVSGTEVRFRGPDLLIGSMFASVKARDLQHDGRLAIHANPGDGSMSDGDAKVSGRANEVLDPTELRDFTEAEAPPGDFHLFRIELDNAVLTSISDDQTHLVIELWRPGAAPTTLRRFH